MTVKKITVEAFNAQVLAVEGVRIELPADAGKVPAYFFTRKLPDNKDVYNIVDRIRKSLGTSGEDLANDDVLVGKKVLRLTGFLNTGKKMTRKMFAERVLLTDLRGDRSLAWQKALAEKADKPADKGAKEDTRSTRRKTVLKETKAQATARNELANKVVAEEATKAGKASLAKVTPPEGPVVTALRGMLAQFSHKPRKGEKKADVLPADLLEAVSFLLNHWHSTGGALEQQAVPNKEQVTTIDALYARAWPISKGLPSQEYMEQFWNVNKYRFSVGHPLTIPANSKEARKAARKAEPKSIKGAFTRSRSQDFD